MNTAKNLNLAATGQCSELTECHNVICIRFSIVKSLGLSLSKSKPSTSPGQMKDSDTPGGSVSSTASIVILYYKCMVVGQRGCS